ncbi:MAG: nucleotidyl transferase AbiEii/AbiGii toxin family protein [Coriobacteriaceae bacterium]
MAIDFKKFAEDVARRGEVEALLPIVEKELIHYDIIRALDESRWLDGLTFQGGTCLRLCYGAVRYSEDLDFTTALDLEESDLAGFRELLSDSLRSNTWAFGSHPKRSSTEGGGSMKSGRWSSTRRRRDPIFLPEIKIDRANTTYRAIFAFLRKTIRSGRMCSRAIIGCQSLMILADKIVSFSQQVLSRAIAIYGTFWIALRPGGIWTRLRSWLAGN